MTNPNTLDPNTLQGLQIIDNDGSKVGKVTTVFLDTQSDRPEWVSVKTGFFGWQRDPRARGLRLPRG